MRSLYDFVIFPKSRCKLEAWLGLIPKVSGNPSTRLGQHPAFACSGKFKGIQRRSNSLNRHCSKYKECVEFWEKMQTWNNIPNFSSCRYHNINQGIPWVSLTIIIIKKTKPVLFWPTWFFFLKRKLTSNRNFRCSRWTLTTQRNTLFLDNKFSGHFLICTKI